MFCGLALPTNCFAQKEESFDEISVILNVQRIGSTEIPIVIIDRSAYLPIKDVFDFLRIKCSISSDLDSVMGFFMTSKSKFIIEKNNNTIAYQDRIIQLKDDDLFKTETNLYLKLEYFGQVFGLDCSFSFSSLSVLMSTKIELPAILEMQQQLLRQNIDKLKGEKKADTVIRKAFQLFHLGIADWAVLSTQQTDIKSNTRLNLALGAMVLGGEANVYLNINSSIPFRKKDQYYNWRYVNNDFKPIRQVTLGTIFTQSISTIYAPVRGIQITNTPTTYRRSFGTYTISNTTEPGWTVELYINNVLVNYVKADASGFYTFEVPMVYGNSVVKLRYYGQMGEVRTSEENINIPFNFLPKNQLEYTFTSGIVQDDEKSRFSRVNWNYGLSRKITVGAGMEYLSTANTGKPIAFFNTSIRLGSGLLFTGEHIYGVISRGLLSYQLPSRIKFEINYGKYQKNQSTIRSGKGGNINFDEERKLMVTVPIRTKKLTAFSRLTFNQLIIHNVVNSSAELLFSAIISGVSTNITTSVAYTDPANKIINSNLSLTLRIPEGIRFTPLIQYDYSQNNLTRIRGEIEKRLTSKGFLNLTFERDILKKLNYYGIGSRYIFSFAQLSFFARNSKSGSSMTQALSGSILYNDKTQSLSVSNQNNVGRAGLIILPFLDVNCNGKRDIGEPKVDKLDFRVNAGRIIRNDKDTTIRVIGLEAYNYYYIEIDKNSLDNIAWQIKNPTIKVIAEPNRFKLIEVPVSVVGEASGKVTLNSNKINKGIGRIIVNIFNKDSIFMARVLTESDGFFSYIGLAPGEYFARVDEGQLKKLNFTILKNQNSFTIKQNSDGDIVDNLIFNIYSIENNVIE